MKVCKDVKTTIVSAGLYPTCDLFVFILYTQAVMGPCMITPAQKSSRRLGNLFKCHDRFWSFPDAWPRLTHYC